MIAVRRLLLLAVLGVLALALSGVAEARIDRRGRSRRRAEGVPAAHRRAREARIRPHALICLAARPRRDPLRVRARDQQVVHGELDRLVERERRIRRADDDDHDHDPRDNDADRGDGRRQAGKALREPALADRVHRSRACPGSPARRTPSTHTSARSRARASPPGARPTDSTSAGRASRRTSTARIRGSSAGRRSRARRPTRCGCYGAKKTFMTTTNVADARDLYTFHRTNPFFTGSIQFRVRAQRKLYGEVVSGLPVTTYGPWSPIYTDVQPPLSLGDARKCRHGVRHPVGHVARSRACPHSRFRLQRRQRRPDGLQRRRAGRAVPRVHRDG